MNRAETATLQLQAVDVLRSLKETRTYDELAEDTGLPAGDLNRYVNGHVLPGADRAQEIVNEIGRESLVEELTSRIERDAEGYIDNSGFVYDQSFLDLVAAVVGASDEFARPDAVLTAAADGVTLAAAIASYYGARCVYAKRSKETAIEAFIEGRTRLEAGIEIAYYLPESALSSGDTVLVVDDLIRSGETQELLLDMAHSAGVEIGGVFTLLAVGEEGVARARSRTEAPIESLIELD